MEFLVVARPLPPRTPPPRTQRVDMTVLRCAERFRRAWSDAERLLVCDVGIALHKYHQAKESLQKDSVSIRKG